MIAIKPVYGIITNIIMIMVCVCNPLNSSAHISSVKSVNTYTDTNWNNLPVVLSKIQAPTFPNRDINIVNVGAKTDGVSLSTIYIQKAIDSCSAVGGGRVVVPAGIFVTGALKLKDHVNLYITKGATLKFSTAVADYLPVVLTRFQGEECYNYSPFIYAYGATNIAITGSGTLDGQASYTNWWGWKGSADEVLIDTMCQQGVPLAQRIFGTGHTLRPVFIQPYNSKNILIDSITIINSPMWEINPVLSQNITVSNVVINSYGPNNDGCDPECCNYVMIKGCSFSTGDDCVAIKAGKNNDGRRVNTPCQNIVIQNCNMQDGHGGITMGSECTGGIRNVYAQNCTLNSTNLATAFRIKTNSVRGGIIENIFMRNCSIVKVSSEVLQVDMYYQEGDVGAFTPIVRNIEIDSVTGSSSPSLFTVNCYARSPISDVRIAGSNFSNVTALGTLKNVCRLQINNTLVNNSVPLIPTAVAGYTEAETYSTKSNWGWSNVLTGFKGNGYMEPADTGNAIEWVITKTQNERDTLSVRYANAGTTGNKPCSLYVNNVYACQFNFAATSSAWANEKHLINLQKGNNIIRLVGININPGAYIDRFSTSLSSLLPVKFTSVFACSSDQKTTVFWKVATEINIIEYIVQQSLNGKDFTDAGVVNAAGLQEYKWEDKNSTENIVYYRIEAVDESGTVTYSDIVFVKTNDDNRYINIFPNPATENTVQVRLENLSAGDYSVRLINTEGQTISNKQVIITNNHSSESITFIGVNRGNYILFLKGKTISATKKIIVL